ncbi:hypothetical protein PCANC_06584 [Puccinia coronata f. sp. avenae]|uniref:Uncharacterized protein n=1 Tax=Puccinia coronata f. sp. avenae TaxID=200324 RepID=A0A2N5VA55_9BASI|nr:hypothetical protein PCANC_06584 [Puccinia coronata f. sp. avenae]
MRTCLESKHAGQLQIKRVAIAVILNSITRATNPNGTLQLTCLLDSPGLPGQYRLLAPRLALPRIPHISGVDARASQIIINGIFHSSKLVLEEILGNQAHEVNVHSKTQGRSPQMLPRLLVCSFSANLPAQFKMRLSRKKIPSASPSEAPIQIAKIMLKKNFAALPSNALTDIDLNVPSVQQLLISILRPLEHLTKAVTKIKDEEMLPTEEDAPDLYQNFATMGGSDLSDALNEEGDVTIYMGEPDSDTSDGDHEEADNNDDEGDGHDDDDDDDDNDNDGDKGQDNNQCADKDDPDLDMGISDSGVGNTTVMHQSLDKDNNLDKEAQSLMNFLIEAR